jgi:hypothetical protein
MDSRLHARSALRFLRLSGLAPALLVAGCCLIGSGGDGDNGSGNNGNNGSNGQNNPPPTSVTLEVIARTGDTVPGQSGATFTYFGNPIIDEEGRVAFYAAYKGGQGDGGLYVWVNEAIKSLYDSDPGDAGSVPGLGAEDYLGGFEVQWDRGAPHLAWGNNGRLLFAAHLNGSPSPDVLLRWRARDGNLLLVSSAEILRELVPDATDEFLPEFYHPGLSNDGIAIFGCRYSYFREDGSFSLFNRGIFTTDGVTTQEIGVGSVPQQPSAASFADKPVLLTSHNAEGEFLFQAEYESGQGDHGVYLLRQDAVARVIDNATGRSFAGLSAGAQVSEAEQNYQAIAIGPDGHIAIDTTLTFGGVTRDTVLLWDGTEWHELQDPDSEYASDLLSGVNDDGQALYLADGEPYLSDAESVVSVGGTLPADLSAASFDWETFGGAVNNHGRALLRYKRQDADESPGLALWSGAQLLVVLDATEPTGLSAIDVIFSAERRGPEAVDRVGTLSDRPEVNRPGLSGALNDADEFAFRAGWLGADGQENTADDEQAIFLGVAK